MQSGHLVQLTYHWHNHWGQVSYRWLAANEDDHQIQRELDANKITDLDGDGIDDYEEDYLLNKFRPYYLFSMEGSDGNGAQEHYNPTDPCWYIMQSSLVALVPLYGDFVVPIEVANNATLSGNPTQILNALYPEPNVYGTIWSDIKRRMGTYEFRI